MSRVRSVVVFALLMSAVLVAAAPPALSASDDLQTARAASARFHSTVQAERAGYQFGGPCVAGPAGAMGIHVVNPALFGNDAIDVRTPEVLLYEPQADGTFKLVGIEYVKADADQNLATDGDRPTLFGAPFDGPMPGHEPGMPAHFELHVWLWRDNPNGIFQPWNPAVSCP